MLFETILDNLSLFIPNALSFTHQRTQDERQVRLREHARRLIAETRARSLNIDSPNSPVKMITQRITLSPERTISPINNTASDAGFAADRRETSPTKRVAPARTDSGDLVNGGGGSRTSPGKERNSPLQSFNSVLERVSPQREKKVCRISYTLNCLFMYFVCIVFSWSSYRTLKVSWRLWNANRSPST